MTSAAPLQRRLRSTIGAALARPRGVRRRDRLVPAAAVVLGVLVVQFVLGLVAMAQAALTTLALPWPVDLRATPVGAFVTTALLDPLPFVLVAGAVLVLLPSGATTLLSTRLLRGLAAGAAGTVALALVGAVQAATSPFAASSPTLVLLSATTVPLAQGVRLTCVLLVSCTVVALASDAPGVDPATDAAVPGAPGTPVEGPRDGDGSVAVVAARSDAAPADAPATAPAAPTTAAAPAVAPPVHPVTPPAASAAPPVASAAPAASPSATGVPRDHAPFLPPEDDR